MVGFIVFSRGAQRDGGRGLVLAEPLAWHLLRVFHPFTKVKYLIFLLLFAMSFFTLNMRNVPWTVRRRG